jgi:hypothetical protein
MKRVEFKVDYLDIMNRVLEKHLTISSYHLWLKIADVIEPVWHRPSSSSKKYHVRDDGSVPDIAEHTTEMLIAAVDIKHLFIGCIVPVELSDVLLLAIALHDAFKYGLEPGKAVHTVKNHDKIAGDFIKDLAEEIFELHFGVENAKLLENCIRFHSGTWSTDIANAKDFGKMDHMVFLVHALDMLSCADKLKLTEAQIGKYYPSSTPEDDIPF